MDNIRKEIKEIKTRLGVIEPTLLMCDLNMKEVVRTQEYVEHRLDLNENLEKKNPADRKIHKHAAYRSK